MMRLNGIAAARRRAVLLAHLWCALLLAVLATPAPSAQPAGSGLLEVQRLVEAAQAGMVRSTVAVRAGGAGGSGVVITPDGLVLTAAHVVGPRGARRISVILADGRQLNASLVGADPASDLAILRAENAQNLPNSPVGESGTLQPRQWVVATGHPLGLRAGRPAVLRIGRVLRFGRGQRSARAPRRISTDAPLISGDSGGPLFDLGGRVVGINSMITSPGERMVSIHSPVDLAKDAISRALRNEAPEAWTGPSADFQEALRAAREALSAGDAVRASVLAGTAAAVDATNPSAQVVLASALARSGKRALAVDALRRALARGFPDASAIRQDGHLVPLTADAEIARALKQLDTLAAIPGTAKSEAANASPDDSVWRGAVRIRSAGRTVVLGTVMSAGGDILTKASELPEGELIVALPNGAEAPARRVAVDARWDVALLRVQARGLAPLRTSNEAHVGLVTFTPNGTGSLAGVGVVGVAEMPVQGRGIAPRPTSKAYMGVQLVPLSREDLAALHVEHGVRVMVEPNMPAAEAGVRDGDVVTEADGRAVADPDELMDHMVGKQPGERLSIRLARGAERLEVTVRLASRPASLPGRGSRPAELSGEVSQMQGPFPRVIHHDALLSPSAMGGPVLDSQGRCLGMNLARADRTSTYILPAREMQELYERLGSTARVP